MREMQAETGGMTDKAEIRGEIALGFTRYSGQPNRGLKELLIAAGLRSARVVRPARESVHWPQNREDNVGLVGSTHCSVDPAPTRRVLVSVDL
jgi:hypothetical protein